MKGIKLVLLFTTILLIAGCHQTTETSSSPSQEYHQEVIDVQLDQLDTVSDGVSDGDNSQLNDKQENINDIKEKDIENNEEKFLSKEELLLIQVEDSLCSMTLEEKIGQMFMVAFRFDEVGQPIRMINEHVLDILTDYKIGGIILFSENINTPEQTKKFIQELQLASQLPLFIAVDEEGGRVSRIANNPDMLVSSLPTSAEIGNEGNNSKAYDTGLAIGTYLKDLGFNMNFAPVADINSNPTNPVIGDRAFGSEPSLVGEMVSEEVKGMQERDIIATLKHFPGHGDTALDSHMGRVEFIHDLERLKTVEWVPFKAGIKAGADVIMVGHINTPNVTKDQLPASLSYEMVTEYLRETLDFYGLVITDALEMGAISNYYSSSEAAIMAIEAGVDILLMPEDFNEAYEGVMKAVKTGRINEKRINESVSRILRNKYKNKILTY